MQKAESNKMEIESEDSLDEKLHGLLNEKTFLRTLYHFKKNMKPLQIEEFTGRACSSIEKVIEKWKNKGTVEDLPRLETSHLHFRRKK